MRREKLERNKAINKVRANEVIRQERPDRRAKAIPRLSDNARPHIVKLCKSSYLSLSERSFSLLLTNNIGKRAFANEENPRTVPSEFFNIRLENSEWQRRNQFEARRINRRIQEAVDGTGEHIINKFVASCQTKCRVFYWAKSGHYFCYRLTQYKYHVKSRTGVNYQLY